MVTTPGQLFLSFFLGLVSLLVLGGGLYLLWLSTRERAVARHVIRPGDPARRPVVVDDRATQHRHPRHRALLTLAVVMLLAVFGGKYLVSLFFSKAAGPVDARQFEASTVHGASGAEISVASSGPKDGPTLVFTHGWGADRRDWSYVIGALPSRYRVVAWDLPGLGASTPAGDYSMQTLAADLDSVVSSVKGRQGVVLVGHSIGGILNLEYARRYPDKLGREVAGLIQVNTTFTNPVETKKGAELSRKLQKPVFEPLLHVMTWISPVVRVAGWLGYQSGLAHLQLASQSFAGAETWDQLDEMARYSYRSSPAVVAQGVLGMLHWDGSDVLAKINVPTLIISGAEDKTTLPAASDRMNRDVPASVQVRVSPAAHLGPVEQYQRYADAIGSFVARPKVALLERSGPTR